MKLLTKFHLSKYIVCLVLLFVLSTFLRLYNFDSRWGLAGDDSRDVAIALEAVQRHDLPPIGPFSSAGPFVFGPIYYWVLMVPYILLPHTLVAPWMFAPIVGTIFVILSLILGNLIGGKKLSLLFGLIAAVSPQLVMRSMMVSQHMFLPLTNIGVLIFLALAWKRHNPLFMLGMGLCIGLGISVHYQDLNLLIFLITPLLIPKLTIKERLLFLIAAGLGILIPSLPLLYWDSHQSFANIRNVMDFFLIGQYRFYVASSWKLFLSQALPNYWSFVIGGNYLVSISLMAISLLIIGYEFLATKLKLTFKNVSAGLFLLLLVLNRYYRGERFEGYLIYLAPFILLFSTLALWFLIKKFKPLGLMVTLIVIICSLVVSLNNAAQADNRLLELDSAVSAITNRHPNTKFTLYDLNGNLSNVSQPLSYLMNNKGLTKYQGYPIGICEGCHTEPKQVILDKKSFEIIDLGSKTKEQLKFENWHSANSENMYDQLVVWARTYSLKSTFSPGDYILERLHLKN